MAKETPPVVQNSKMLVLSLGLALLVVVLYNVQINKIRTESKGTTERLWQYKIEKKAGDTISAQDDVVAVEVNSDIAKGFKNIKRVEEITDSPIGQKLSHGVAAGDWVMRDDYGTPSSTESAIPAGQGYIAIPIDPNYSPGKMLHLGALVNVLGEVQVRPGQFKTVRLIDGLVVKSIGGNSVTDFARPGEESSKQYRDIGSSLPRDMVAQWYNVLSYVKGGRVILELRNPRDQAPATLEFGSEVKDKLDKADPTHGSYTPSGGGSGPMAPPL
jgi:hypothetical protein